MGDHERQDGVLYRKRFEGKPWSEGLRQKAEELCTEYLNALSPALFSAQASTEKVERAFADLVNSALAEGQDYIDHIEVKCPSRKCKLWLWLKKDPHTAFWEGKCECGQTLSILPVEKKNPFAHEGSETGG